MELIKAKEANLIRTRRADGRFNWDNTSLVNREIEYNTQQQAEKLEFPESDHFNPNLIKHLFFCSLLGMQISWMSLSIDELISENYSW